MTQEQMLIEMQKQLVEKFMMKLDIYHSEKHRGIIVVAHGKPLHPNNILSVTSY